MVDAGACSGDVRQKDTRLLCGACLVRQGSRFNHKDVIGHLTGRDAPLSRVYASDGVPMQAKAYRRGDNLAIIITVSTDVVCLAISQ